MTYPKFSPLLSETPWVDKTGFICKAKLISDYNCLQPPAKYTWSVLQAGFSFI